MKKRYKNKWVKALHSGKYRQGTGALCRQGKPREYCCLGVARSLFKLGSDGEYLSESALAEIGLTEEQQWKLADMNDAGHSFAAIGEYIEERL